MYTSFHTIASEWYACHPKPKLDHLASVMEDETNFLNQCISKLIISLTLCWPGHVILSTTTLPINRIKPVLSFHFSLHPFMCRLIFCKVNTLHISPPSISKMGTSSIPFLVPLSMDNTLTRPLLI